MKTADAFEKALKEIYDSIPQFLAQNIYQEKKELSPFPPNQEKIESDLKKDMISFQQRCHKGFTIILSELKKQDLPSLELPAFEKKLNKSFRSLMSPQPFTQAILKVVSGTSWRETLSIPVSELEWLYRGAKTLFDTGKYVEASDAFTFLSWFDSTQPDFWLALGHSCFHTGEYTRAISAYGVASSSLPQEPWPHIHAAACYEALGDLDQARNCLMEGQFLEGCRENPDKHLIGRIETKLKDYERGISTPIS